MARTTQSPASGKTMVFARRTFSTLLLWAVVAAVFVSHWAWAYLGLVSLLAVLSSIEYFRMLKAAKVACFPGFGVALAAGYSVGLQWFQLRGGHPPAWFDALAVFIALAGAFTLQLRRPIRGLESLQGVAFTVLGFVYIAVFFHFAARVLFITPDAFANPGRVGELGALLLLWLLAVTKFTDMGAYITGSLVGRHKMIPHVSPAKTWEGFAGAFAFAQLAACGLPLIFPPLLAVLGGWGHAIALGFILALLAVVGDLAESIVKRALDAKDSGRMLPGIGGALDLIDSVCFTAPALYFYLQWIHPAA
ncbi:MAG TPA: phosphatidate cytidylyltransferase [Luteolibacter sp.]|nr:phosphatidate cytidylyltransferase [Luteolibacter sp.]